MSAGKRQPFVRMYISKQYKNGDDIKYGRFLCFSVDFSLSVHFSSSSTQSSSFYLLLLFFIFLFSPPYFPSFLILFLLLPPLRSVRLSMLILHIFFYLSFFLICIVLSRVRGSVTNSNGFRIGWLDLLTHPFTITLNYNQLQQLTINDCLRLAPFLTGPRMSSLLLWLTWYWFTNRPLLQLPLSAG
jgi:hypothetical protein